MYTYSARVVACKYSNNVIVIDDHEQIKVYEYNHNNNNHFRFDCIRSTQIRISFVIVLVVGWFWYVNLITGTFKTTGTSM